MTPVYPLPTSDWQVVTDPNTGTYLAVGDPPRIVATVYDAEMAKRMANGLNEAER